MLILAEQSLCAKYLFINDVDDDDVDDDGDRFMAGCHKHTHTHTHTARFIEWKSASFIFGWCEMYSTVGNKQPTALPQSLSLIRFPRGKRDERLGWQFFHGTFVVAT